MSQKKIKLLRKIAFGQEVPKGHILRNGSNLEITNKTINRRVKRFYNGLSKDLKSKFQKNTPTVS